MTPERWKQVVQIFESAMDAPAAEREALLDGACRGDAELRLEVKAMLASEPGFGGAIQSSIASHAAQLALSGEALLGKRVGSWRLAQVLGQGGTSTVFLAIRDDQAFQKQAAIKLIKRGMETSQVLLHFHRERQILAQLDHPNIARLLDAGSTDFGTPYFVMEYVDGMHITDYCTKHNLSVSARLRLFQQVCSAVHFAHKNLVVHRDLKPGNILVTADDKPKLLDFGLAKLLQPDPLSDTTVTTARMLTPDYASPEQVRGEPITTATDVYSLGVVLYEMMTARRPYEVSTDSWAEMERTICQNEPPRLGAVVPSLRGDLENIVMMAMRKEPARRYGSAEQLGEDIRRYLANLPVAAERDTLLYRGRKFARRHWISLAAAFLLGASLFGGVLFSGREMRFALAAQRRAELQTCVANLTAADLHLRMGDSVAARDRLNECPATLRDWEWHYLRRESDSSFDRLYMGETIPVDSAAFGFAPDGQRILFNDLHTVYAWKPGTTEPAARYSGFGSILSISRDGRRIVSKTYTGGVESDFSLRVFDLESKQLISQFGGHSREVGLAVFDDSGRVIASTDAGGAVRVWDPQSGRDLGLMPQALGVVEHLSISRGGSRVAGAGRTDTAWMWDVSSGTVRRLEGGGHATSIAFSPDGGRVAAGSADRRLREWDAQRGTLLVTSEPENGDVYSVAFSPDGTKILASIGGGAVQILDAATGASAGMLLGQAGRMVSPFGQVSFTPDGTRVIKAEGESLQIWNTASSSNGMILRHVSGEQEGVSAVAVAPNHRYVAAGGRSLHLWDARSGAEITESGGKYSIHALAFSPDSRLLAAGLISGRLNIHDAATGMLLFTLDGHHERVTKIIFNGDGSRLLSSSADRTVRTWRMDAHSGTMLVELADAVNSIALSPDERRLATGSGDLSFLHRQRGPNIRIWDTATGRTLLDIDTQKTTRNDPGFEYSKQNLELRGVSSIAFSPDGRSILSAENMGPNVRSWDASSGAFLRAFAVSGQAVYLPRGTRMLSAVGGHLAVIDAGSGERILSFREEFRPLSQIAVSADGGMLVEAPPYGAIRVRDATPTYEPEAAEYVRSLYSLRGFHEDVTGAIRANKTLTPPMRDASLRMAALLRDAFPEALNRKSLLAVRSARNGPAAYRRAVTASERACRVAPWNPVYFNTLGIALYRSELYENALGVLTQARQMRGTATVSNLAFTALAQYRLGRREEAAATLRAMKLVISKSSDDVHTIEGNADELARLVAEAESVISPASSK